MKDDMPARRFKCPVAVHLVLIENDQLLLMRRYNTGYADGMYALPAGCIDGGESVTQAMIREAKEEIGITLKPEWLSVSTVMHRKEAKDSWESIVLFFTLSHYEGSIHNCEPEKCDDLRFFPLNHLPTNLVPYVKQGLINTQRNIPFSEFGWQK
jgi:8-oxo-dGTP diphosphatase